MEELFARASLSYLTTRSDEGFLLISSSIIKNNIQLFLDYEEREVFCLVSMNTIETRYKSWIHLNRLLTQTESIKKRQSIQVYIREILTEFNSFCEKILFLINEYLLNPSITNEVRLFYFKIQGDVHFLISQTSKSERKSEHMLNALSIYNQALEINHDQQSNSYDASFLSIIYNKALIFVLLTEENNLAKNLLHDALKNAKTGLLNINKTPIESEKQLKRIESLVKYLDQA